MGIMSDIVSHGLSHYRELQHCHDHVGYARVLLKLDDDTLGYVLAAAQSEEDGELYAVVTYELARREFIASQNPAASGSDAPFVTASWPSVTQRP
jgi:hypothetical protein